MHTKTSQATTLEASLPPLGGARWNPLSGSPWRDVYGTGSKLQGCWYTRSNFIESLLRKGEWCAPTQKKEDLPFQIGLINLEQSLWSNLLLGVWWCLHAQHPVGDIYSMAWDSRMWSGTYWQFRGMRGMMVDTNSEGYLSEVFKCSWSLRPASCYGGKADEAAEASRSLEASFWWLVRWF